MGFWQRILSAIGISKKKVNILFVGLDNSGKTTIVNSLKPTPEKEIIPTVGFTVETFSRARVYFIVFDMSGQGRYRDLWEHYYPEVDGVVFVIDSADKTRLCVARDELEHMLNHQEIQKRKIPLLFLANKKDIPTSASPSDISFGLGLEHIKDRNWYICACSAVTGENVDEGMDWLAGKGCL